MYYMITTFPLLAHSHLWNDDHTSTGFEMTPAQLKTTQCIQTTMVFIYIEIKIGASTTIKEKEKA